MKNSLISNANTVAIYEGADSTIVEASMNNQLNKIYNRLLLNKLVIEYRQNSIHDKGKLFGNYSESEPKDLEIQMKGIKLKSVENYKYFGIIFDSKLRW